MSPKRRRRRRNRNRVVWGRIRPPDQRVSERYGSIEFPKTFTLPAAFIALRARGRMRPRLHNLFSDCQLFD
jgi:hypothetical protein